MDYLKDIFYILSLFYRLSTKSKREKFSADANGKLKIGGFSL